MHFFLAHSSFAGLGHDVDDDDDDDDDNEESQNGTPWTSCQTMHSERFEGHLATHGSADRLVVHLMRNVKHPIYV
jgi:hypothetical protein